MKNDERGDESLIAVKSPYNGCEGFPYEGLVRFRARYKGRLGYIPQSLR